MPWHVKELDVGQRWWLVIENSTEDVVGVFRSRSDALGMLRALYASESDKTKPGSKPVVLRVKNKRAVKK